MPNAKILSEKQAIVADLTEKFKNAAAGVIVDYRGITVAEDTAWSWRYTAENGGEAAVTLSSTKPNGEAGITNTYVKHDWLTSIVDVINKWTAKDNIDNTGHVPGSGTN